MHFCNAKEFISLLFRSCIIHSLCRADPRTACSLSLEKDRVRQQDGVKCAAHDDNSLEEKETHGVASLVQELVVELHGMDSLARSHLFPEIISLLLDLSGLLGPAGVQEVEALWNAQAVSGHK